MIFSHLQPMFGKILYTLFTRFFATLMQGAVIIMASHLYGAEGKGSITLLHTDIFLLLLGCQIFGGMALIYLTPIKNTFQLYLISTLWNLAVVSLAIPYIMDFSNPGHWDRQHIWWLAFIQSGINTNLMFLLGENKIKAYNRVIILQSILTFCALIGINFYYPHASQITYFYALLFSWSLSWYLSFVSITHSLKPWTFKGIHHTFKALFYSGLPIQFTLLIEFILMRGQLYLMNNADSSPKQLHNIGVYSNALSVAEAVGLLTISIALVEYAGLSNLADPILKRQKGLQVFRSGILVTVFLLLFIWWLPEGFYSYLFGKEFSSMRKLIHLMTPGILGLAITRILGAYYYSKGQSWTTMLSTFIGIGIAALLFQSDLDQHWDYMDAAYSFTLSYSASAVIMLTFFFVNDHIKFTELIPAKEDLKQLKEQVKEMREPRPGK